MEIRVLTDIMDKTKRMCANEECRVNLKQSKIMAVDPKGLGTYTTKEIQDDAKIQPSEVRWSTVNKGKNKNVLSILRSAQSVTTYTNCKYSLLVTLAL